MGAVLHHMDGAFFVLWKKFGAARCLDARCLAREQPKHSLVDANLLPVPRTDRSPPSSVGRAQGP